MPQSLAPKLLRFSIRGLDMQHAIMPLRGDITSCTSISYKDNSFERQLETTVDIKRFEEIVNLFKIRIPSVIISHSNH